MESISLIADNLRHSREIVLSRIEEMSAHCMVPPTSNGGAHTLWVLGHLAYIEALVIESIMLGKDNPLEHWKDVFDGDDNSLNASDYPSFDEVLMECRGRRQRTEDLLRSLTEADLDAVSRNVPRGTEDLFGTYRKCLQYVANHWFMHRGQLADARRAAGMVKMWY